MKNYTSAYMIIPCKTLASLSVEERIEISTKTVPKSLGKECSPVYSGYSCKLEHRNEHLKTCDCAILFPGWEDDDECRFLKKSAEFHKKPIYCLREDKSMNVYDDYTIVYMIMPIEVRKSLTDDDVKRIRMDVREQLGEYYRVIFGGGSNKLSNRIQYIETCDAVMLYPGWGENDTCRILHEAAQHYLKPIYNYLGSVNEVNESDSYYKAVVGGNE